MLCRFCQIVDFTKSTFKMSILSNKHVDFTKSTFDKIDITYIYTELIEKKLRDPLADFWQADLFLCWLDNFEFWTKVIPITEL